MSKQMIEKENSDIKHNAKHENENKTEAIDKAAKKRVVALVIMLFVVLVSDDIVDMLINNTAVNNGITGLIDSCYMMYGGYVMNKDTTLDLGKTVFWCGAVICIVSIFSIIYGLIWCK